jgi:hypothetical protein
MDSMRLAAIFLSSLITVVLIIIGIFFSFFKIKKGLMAYVYHSYTDTRTLTHTHTLSLSISVQKEKKRI